MDNAHNRRAEDRRAPGALQWGEQAASAAPAGVQQSAPERYGYTITPRAAHLGGGWRLQLMEDGQEVGCSLHPAAGQAETDDAYQEALEDGEAWLSSRGAEVAPPVPAGEQSNQMRRCPGGAACYCPDDHGQPPAPGQVAQASGIEGLPAYHMGSRPVCFAPGVYYAASDVERLLATQSAKQGAQSPSMDRQAYLLACWLKSGVCAQVDGKKLRDDILQWLNTTFIAPGEIAQASVEQATGAKEEIRNQALEEAAMMFQHGCGESWIAEAIRKLRSERIDRASTAGAEGKGQNNG